ncbi:hypothetical protein C3L33_17216, partial [Rhododendron williamsianum]
MHNALDSLVWHFSSSGTYNVRSGYMTALELMGETRGTREEVSSVAWQRPSTGFVKINVDGGWAKFSGKGAYGVVIRGANGMFMAAASGCLSWCRSPEIAEAMAVRHGVQLGLQLGLNAVMVESDSKAVIDMINGHAVVSQSVNSIIHNVKEETTNTYSEEHTPRLHLGKNKGKSRNLISCGIPTPATIALSSYELDISQASGIISLISDPNRTILQLPSKWTRNPSLLNIADVLLFR